uniref:PIN domain-containing protein n=1 Tax=Candidatus Kentrum sp. UNK TaxID=2126344 RepID=A0A451AT31_9GAMM|nr:MAG: hypothetical protein BECKUNK1418G_GA0071005_10115 [Candidatus Kentron sp. UNK]VFK69208.1 MAG: hypothetical protein BECKUNK1418H_GA0071006_10125 [Candidatus Kentron sp. UNK]
MEVLADNGCYTFSPVPEPVCLEKVPLTEGNRQHKKGKDIGKARELAKRFKALTPDAMTSTDASRIYDEWTSKMIIDASALLAILLREKEEEIFCLSLKMIVTR